MTWTLKKLCVSLLVVLLLVASSCSHTVTEEDIMLKQEIGGAAAPLAGDQLPPGRWTVDEVALGDSLEEVEALKGEPRDPTNLNGPVRYLSFRTSSVKIGVDSDGKVVSVDGSKVAKDGEKMVVSGNSMQAIPWKLGVEGKAETHYQNGRYFWSSRIEIAQSVEYRLPERGTLRFHHSEKSGDTHIYLEGK